MAILSFSAMVSLVPFLLFSTPVSAVGCFSGGQSLDFTPDVQTAITSACGSLSFNYAAGEVQSTCQNIGDNRIDFAVKNVGSGSADMSQNDCESQNDATAGGCGGHGGIRAFGDFQLTFDPNTGNC